MAKPPLPGKKGAPKVVAPPTLIKPETSIVDIIVPATIRPSKTTDDEGLKFKSKKVVGTDKIKHDSKSANKKKNKDDELDCEPMFESNGVYYILGNRTLNCLNLCSNKISDTGIKYLLDAATEQELTSTDGADLIGIFRIILQFNNISADSTNLSQLNTVLNARNPFFEEQEVSPDGNQEVDDQGDAESVTGEE
jgi:hypothetical protein